MSGFEYGNARLRAMRSRFFRPRDLAVLSESSSLGEMIQALAQSTYRRSMELSLMQGSDIDSIFEALRQDYNETVVRITHFYTGSEKSLILLYLRGYDIQNMKSVLRGLEHRLPPADIRRSFLPACELPENILSDLMRTSTPRSASDLLVTLGHPYASPLMALRAEHPGAELFEFELALDRWRFEQTIRALRNTPDDTQALLQALALEADIANLMTVLRFVNQPIERPGLVSFIGKDGLGRLLVGPGHLKPEQLDKVLQAKSIREAGTLLSDSPYGQVLMEILLAYEKSGRLSLVEKALLRYQFQWLVGLIAKDPLGIGVVLGFLALKANEIANIRRISVGVQRGLDPDEIREGLEVLG